MLKQLNAEIECFNRKLLNLEDAIKSEDLAQIEIEFASVSENYIHMKNEFLAIKEDLEEAEELIYDTPIVFPQVEKVQVRHSMPMAPCARPIIITKSTKTNINDIVNSITNSLKGAMHYDFK